MIKLSWSVLSVPNMLIMLLCKHSGLAGSETSDHSEVVKLVVEVCHISRFLDPCAAVIGTPKIVLWQLITLILKP